MPLDSVWLPFGAQYKGLPFTIDNRIFMQDQKEGWSVTNWYKMALETKNVKLIPKTHPGFQIDDEDDTWEYFAAADGFIKSAISTDKTKPYLTADTAVLKQANFPDFMNIKAREIWQGGLESLNSQVAFDGISLEEDGPYTTCDGECPGTVPDPSPPQLEST